MGRLKIAVIASFCLMFLLSLVSLIPTTSYAMTDPVLPPRPTPDPVSATSGSSIGSTIMLSIPVVENSSMNADNWTVVQWKDVHGKWNDVDGWQGNLSYNQAANNWEVIWWVDRSNFGEQDFRWVIYSDETRLKKLATSPTFDLPVNQMQGVVVTLE